MHQNIEGANITSTNEVYKELTTLSGKTHSDQSATTYRDTNGQHVLIIS